MSRGSEAPAPPPPPPPPAAGAAPPPDRGAEPFGHLAAALAHEVRNPLNAMSIHLELLEGRLPAQPRGNVESAARSLGALREGIARIDATLERFLRATGAREAERAPVAIRPLLVSVVERSAAAAAGVRVVIERGASDEPGGDAEAPWPVDAAALQVALEALLDNAIAASRAGGTVRVLADRSGDRGVIRIVDDGVGMDAATLAQAGRIGFSTRGRAGLGLAVARQAIKGQGGALSLTSPGPGQGATARLELLFGE